MARSPLSETIYRVQGMITYVRENLSTDEFMLFLDLLVPEPEQETPKTPAKKKRKSSKSRRASGMAEQLNKTLHQQRQEAADLNLCVHRFPNGAICNEPESDAIHTDAAYGRFHPFVPDARAALPQSETNDAESGGGVSSGTQPDDVGPVAHEANGRD